MNNWAFKDGALSRSGSRALWLLAAAMVAAIIYCEWTSDVEDALQARMRHVKVLPPHLAGVACDAPSQGLVVCRVKFVRATTLPNTSVTLPVASAPFSAAFNVYMMGQNLRVRTPYEGHELSFERGATALQATFAAAQRAAETQLGPQMARGLNALSYENAGDRQAEQRPAGWARF